MAQQDFGVVRALLEAYGRGDVEEMLRHVDPEIELHSAIVGGAEANVFRGHAGFRNWHAESSAGFEELSIELTEYRHLGDRILAFGQIHARGRESGVEIDSPTGWVFTLRDGMILRAEGFLSREDAIAPAGRSD